MGTGVSQKSVDGGSCSSCARFDKANRHGTRNHDIVGESLLLPHSRADRLPAAY